MNILDTLLYRLADTVVYNGASLFSWGEPEISDTLISGYENVEERE